MKLNWFQSASLLLVRASVSSELPLLSNIKLLNVTRSSQSTFFPNRVVFPGGSLDYVDVNSAWGAVLARRPDLTGLDRFNPSRPRPLALTTMTISSCDSLDGDLAYRLCSIRETFEETGVLLADPISPSSSTTQCPIDPGLLHTWRLKCLANSDEFLQLFVTELPQYVPSVHRLHEWFNLLTPNSLKGKRHDTLFYLCCLSEDEYSSCCHTTHPIPEFGHPTDHNLSAGNEVTDICWTSLNDLGASVVCGHSLLAVPQITILSYLVGAIRDSCHMSSQYGSMNPIRSLDHFAHRRGLLGLLPRSMPYIILAIDGGLVLMPGDVLYPEDPKENHRRDSPDKVSTSILSYLPTCSVTPYARHITTLKSRNTRLLCTKRCQIVTKFGHAEPDCSIFVKPENRL